MQQTAVFTKHQTEGTFAGEHSGAFSHPPYITRCRAGGNQTRVKSPDTQLQITANGAVCVLCM